MLLVANNSMAKFGGATALAAIGIINTVSNLLAFPIMGVTQGASALWGYNYGAGKIDRVRRLSSIVLLLTTAIGVLATAAIELFPHAFIAVFNGSDPKLIEIGSRGMSVFMLSFFTVGLQMTAANLFISVGKAAKGGLLFILRQVLFIAAMAVLPLFMGIEGVYWSGPLTDIVCTAIAGVVLIRGLKTLAPSAEASSDEPPEASPEAKAAIA
jgi:Na+-driven multidrug efflux pump